MATEAATVGRVVGENLARLRVEVGQSQRDLETWLKSRGLDWSASHVASIESGRREDIELSTLLRLSQAFEKPLSYWFGGDGLVALGPGLTASRGAIRGYLRGADRLPVNLQIVPGAARVSLRGRLTPAGRRHYAQKFGSEWAIDEVDRAMARRLSEQLGREIGALEVSQRAQQLWGRYLVEERNRRVPAGHEGHSLRTLRGRVARLLQQELAQALDGRNKR